ncbi:hypothetical protein LCGC14_0732460 [marine sediment metagenome]|uniref:Uncharacterized protein n=1 Tax=marine sediment metagenome TaxID=412755 RepID=A0A0F9Q953_9ZZZZ
MGRSSNLIRLTEGQAKAAGEILARAFHDYPQYDYLFTNVDEKIRKLPEVNIGLCCEKKIKKL